MVVHHKDWNGVDQAVSGTAISVLAVKTVTKLYQIFFYIIVHNKYTMAAKSVIKTARNQMMEIEACPDCYLTSCTQEENWFAKPCVSMSPSGASIPRRFQLMRANLWKMMQKLSWKNLIFEVVTSLAFCIQ